MFSSREEIAERLKLAGSEARIVDFVLETLLDEERPFLPAVSAPGYTPLFQTRAVELTVIEIRIAARMLERWSLIHPMAETATAAATAHLWRRLREIRDQSRESIAKQANAVARVEAGA
jgi:hypothetical protein